MNFLYLHRPGIPTFGKNVVVAGRSKNVGMPIAMLLHTDGRHERPGGKFLCTRVLVALYDKSYTYVTYAYYLFCSAAGDATVTISHRNTPKDQLRQYTKMADIVVAAAGLCHCLSTSKCN